jgi:hypothetical protein
MAGMLFSEIYSRRRVMDQTCLNGKQQILMQTMLCSDLIFISISVYQRQFYFNFHTIFLALVKCSEKGGFPFNPYSLRLQ